MYHFLQFKPNAKEAWRLYDERQLSGLEQPPAFMTVLKVDQDPENFAENGEDPLDHVKYMGPMYFDFDGPDLDAVLESVRTVLTHLTKKLDIDKSFIHCWLSGKKGVHVTVPARVFGLKAPVKALPLIYREVAETMKVEHLDMVVYSAGRGRMWRCENIQRPTGTFKVGVTYDELVDMDSEQYATLVAQPRPSMALNEPSDSVIFPKAEALFKAARIRAAKRLGTFTANFTDGLNVICGENARGKSTLIQAIEAALFGVTVVPGKKEHIPTWGQTTFGLELHFEVDNARYILTRSKSTAKLVERASGGDALVANGNTPVTAYVEELLGLTAKDFALFLNSKQHQTSGLLSFGTTALNQKVEEFAGIALIDSIMTRARAMATAEKAAADACSVSAEELDHARAVLEAAELNAQETTSASYVTETALDSFPPLAATPPAVSSSALQATQRIAQRAESALREAEAALEHKREAVVTAE